MQYPASELEYWSLFFAIDDKPEKPEVDPKSINVKENVASFKDLWS